MQHAQHSKAARKATVHFRIPDKTLKSTAQETFAKLFQAEPLGDQEILRVTHLRSETYNKVKVEYFCAISTGWKIDVTLPQAYKRTRKPEGGEEVEFWSWEDATTEDDNSGSHLDHVLKEITDKEELASPNLIYPNSQWLWQPQEGGSKIFQYTDRFSSRDPDKKSQVQQVWMFVDPSKDKKEGRIPERMSFGESNLSVYHPLQRHFQARIFENIHPEKV